jgi:HEPN domain-containing protein
MSRKDEVEILLTRAREFLKTAEYQIDNCLYNLAAFNLEQSLQLFLKAKLLENGMEYPRTHSIRTLLQLLSDIVGEKYRDILKNMLDKYLLELGILEDAYISSRYLVREFKKEEVEKLRKAVEELMNNVP